MSARDTGAASVIGKQLQVFAEDSGIYRMSLELLRFCLPD